MSDSEPTADTVVRADEGTPPTAEQVTRAEEASGPADTGRWRRLVSFLRTFGSGQLLLVLVGCAALLIGAINAWRAEASTTPLIVGAILLLAAFVFGPTLGELRLRHGETELFARYRESVQEALVTSATPEELVQRVEQLETAAKEGEVEKAMESLRKKFYRSISESMRRQDEALRSGESKAEVSVLGSSAYLTLRTRRGPSGTLVNAAECVVTDPSGRTASGTATSTLGAVASVRRFSLTYPRDFVGADPLVPGTYRVEWRARPLIAALAGVGRRSASVLAEMTFSVPNGATGGQQEPPRSAETPLAPPSVERSE